VSYFQAMRRTFALFKNFDLDVRIVCYGGPDAWVEDMIEELGGPKRVIVPPKQFYQPSKMMFIESSSSSDDEHSLESK
jgi:hypothetical protein